MGPFLRAREAEHNLALGLLGRLRVEPRLYGFDPTFVVVEQEGEVVGCLLRTPPHGVVLSRFEESLRTRVFLTFFIPLIMATGGNTGIQSSTIVIRLLVTHWYENRSAVVLGDDPAATPLGYRELVAPYRRMALC